ncbi:uncharacterized protein LOC111446004 isoform X1 [Cucurbita moschata]|uniref:Uncharacterized protein LOC111446004 isoform X1 n=1 Tax=Cucurbita moschata TaxID=3662 RepID=A0A6J1FJE9_CUCMO|nr:uncharacterized protein LOC111446004 isoform X1 [Cucurbita moschata]XP_022940373.1 uncharacterized protein LOC111446004 isoform X1 [Cucurbita moschata]
MDFRYKANMWVGNMFQKFEAACQEMDNIMNQDTVKYVENQVSSASENVKKLYSGVVQGLLPRVEDSVKYEAKEAAQRGHVPVNAYGKDANNDVNKSSVGRGSTDQLDNCSRVSCKATFVDEEVAEVPNHSLSIPSSHSPSNISETNDTNKRASSVRDDSDMQLEDDVCLVGTNDEVLTDKDASKKSEEDTAMEFDASDPLKHIADCTSCQVNVTNGEEILISDNSHPPLESSRLSGKNSNDLSDENSDEVLKKGVIIEPNTTNDLNNDRLSHERSERNFVSKEADDSNLLLKPGRIDNECEEDIVTSTRGPPVTSIHGTDVESAHNVTQASSILVNNLVHFSPKLETTPKNLENGTGRSNAPDATSSELVSYVLTRGETVEETRPVSSLKSLQNFSNCTFFPEEPADQRASIEYESRPCFEGVVRASIENKALEMKFVSSSGSLSLMDSLGTHASRANESAFHTKLHTTSQVAFSKSTSSRDLSLSTEVGTPRSSLCRPNNSRCSILDAELETVDLGHPVTVKDECDSVDYKAFHAISRRTQKLRSYKKRIQEAFSSKKRLAKEYEQLAIWFEDIDLEFGTDGSQKLDTKNVSTSYASDSEWELL